jgi:hypothetical protein
MQSSAATIVAGLLARERKPALRGKALPMRIVERFGEHEKATAGLFDGAADGLDGGLENVNDGRKHAGLFS